MIAEPYICESGRNAGKIEWYSPEFRTLISQGLEWLRVSKAKGCDGATWCQYADLEREKLRELRASTIDTRSDAMENERPAFTLLKGLCPYYSGHNGLGISVGVPYSSKQYHDDSESNRLLKRAEFLKAVCEKEGVEWLPKLPRQMDPLPYCSCEEKRDPGCAVHELERRERDIVKALCSCKGDLNDPAVRHDLLFCGVPPAISQEQPERDYYTKTESERALIEIARDTKTAELRMNAVVEHLHGMFCNMDLSLWPKDQERQFRQATETLRRWFR